MGYYLFYLIVGLRELRYNLNHEIEYYASETRWFSSYPNRVLHRKVILIDGVKCHLTDRKFPLIRLNSTKEAAF